MPIIIDHRNTHTEMQLNRSAAARAIRIAGLEIASSGLEPIELSGLKKSLYNRSEREDPHTASFLRDLAEAIAPGRPQIGF